MKKTNTKLSDIVNLFAPKVKIIVRDYKSCKIIYEGPGFYLTGTESICKMTIKDIDVNDNIICIKVS